MFIHTYRWLLFPSYFSRLFNNSHRLMTKNFERKTFDYFLSHRLKLFNGNQEQMTNQIRANLESLLQTSSVLHYLKNFNTKNSKHDFKQSISIEQLSDILFFAYQHNLKLDLFTKHLLECVSPITTKTFSSNFYLELINLFVFHQQKHYDHQTKNPNEILLNFIHHLELNLQIENLSLTDLSLLSSTMYRLQIPIKNLDLLHLIGQYLIHDENTKSLSAVDKQNLIKILTLSNYGRINIAEALVNRFNQSFEQYLQTNLISFSYEIVRMTMRIGIYLSSFHFYSQQFFSNCLKLIEFESNSIEPTYRAKDIIQIMNTLIYMGYIRKINSKYLDLINIYHRMNQFDEKPERLVDLLAPLATIDYFHDELLKKLFTKNNLQQLTESRMKEKLFFISQSYQRPLLDQNYLDTLPHHLFGSWEIEKRKRPYFSLIMQRLLQCVPNRSYVKSAFLLKHFKSPNIIIRLNAQQQPQIISNEMKNKSLRFFEENECSMYAIEVLSKDELCINEPFRPLGLVYSKARQLQKLKYQFVLIYPNDSLDQVKTTQEVFEWIIHRAHMTELLLNENY